MIVGLMFCKNEGDVLPVTIPAAMRLVDSLFISDDGSGDGSWEIIKYFHQNYPDKIELIRQQPDQKDQGQRQALLNEVRNRYKPEDTWVQVIDADMILHTDNLRQTIEINATKDSIVNWVIMNAVRQNWEGVHQFYPHWPEDIRKIMPLFHRLEKVTYSFRPYPELYYTPEWKPWPKGFGKYVKNRDDNTPLATKETVPLILHYGYRGPTHVYKKLGGRPKDKYGQEYDSIESVSRTFNFFNGTYNIGPFVKEDPREAWEESNGK